MKNMQEKYRAFVKFIDKIYSCGAVVCLLVVVVSCSIQVFTRYVLNASLMGTEEVTSYSFMWMTMLGIAVCTQKDSHSAVSILNDLLKSRAKSIHKILIFAAMAFGMVVLFIQGINMMKVAMRQNSPVLRFPMRYIYLCLPVGSLGVLLNLVVQIMDHINIVICPERGET